MIKLAVFDWNGTILSDVQLTHRATQHEFSVVGVPPFSLSHLRKHFEIPLSKYYANMGVSESTLAEHSAVMSAAFHEYYEKYIATTRTRPGARAMLDALHARGISRIILSNHHVRGIQEQLDRLKLGHHFEAVLANDDIHGALHLGKAARLEAYIEQHRVDPRQAFIIGDTSEEIAIGKALGLKTVAISGGVSSVRRLKAAKPDVLISSLHDLIDAVKDF